MQNEQLGEQDEAIVRASVELGQTDTVTIRETRTNDINIGHRCQLQQTGGLGTNNPETNMKNNQSTLYLSITVHTCHSLSPPLVASQRSIKQH